MVSQLCWGCLSTTGLRQTSRALLHPQYRQLAAKTTTSLFSTSAIQYANPLQKKSRSMEGSPKFRESKSARMRKPKKATTDRGRPPLVGERKALRKRIVLSNTNALEVPGMQEFSEETMVDSRIRGSVLALPVPMITQLRALQAFKPSQGWSLFRRPGVVLRRETLEMGRVFEGISTEGPEKGKVVKKILTGKKASGKSVHLLQAMAMALLKKWVVISVPEPQDLVIAQTAYAPIPDTNPVQYVQEQATSELLQRTVLANEEVLSKLHVALEHPELKSLIRPKMTLDELARLGIQDVTISWPVFQAFWAELNATAPPTKDTDDKAKSSFEPRPPVLVTVDGLSHWMQDSKYRNADFKPIHAHDLAFVKHFLSLLQPASSNNNNNKPQLPNGGILLYATSGSNNPSVPSFDIALDQLAARQQGIAESSADFPEPDPYAKIDNRVLNLFKQASTSKSSSLELQTLGGLSRSEARGFMEYFARSGILQEKITEEWVSEKWSIAGGGIIGEMEKLGKRLRTVL
ncbi:mitochondrial ribosomal protein DAP3, putative [Talaromyces stipitatus ATCC 10500]|uniref:Small ribosomal subunit protein mS29 n=1 Tax=Talaromyces stipitatus (strain ATCC 10500 / CBS 375.48 / QM 6759 / NRRL 1006) TaxID=441959 RepID=B8MDM6_TALSN|nr:mitochondrial ribosomal protein DAP3, putative [Talaromyces stipitatus ATCC 10500]EED18255.1 mitochondrial ribosomal protein DAP3, putative [Talaromyces stipitatus ATCC 10500]